jgi:putative ATPase
VDPESPLVNPKGSQVDELFTPEGQGDKKSPLADRMRPRVLDDILGQDHIVGPGRLLRRAIQADRLSSVIFYGPPGTGKTSLARVIANTTSSVFESLNAVLTGIKDIREVIDRSDERLRLYGRRTILFVDEVHRWNKAQQDALLPWVENGTVILIGATTENPFFEVNRALVSRSRIFQLKPLETGDLLKAAMRTLSDKENGYGKWNVTFEEGALEHLAEVAGGDARSLLNALELAVETSGMTDEISSSWPPPEGAEIFVSLEAAEESIQRRALLYDRDGDYHYDTISAFIKSVRGSDPDAALYWLAKMVRAGEDPAFIFRRMIILAMEDVGLADPTVISTVISCAEAFDRIGFPEGNFALSEACLCLATAPKSNTTLAYFDALKEVEKEDSDIPAHLRDASRDAESFGHGEGYIYPHAYRDHWAAQAYLPTALLGRTFYTPSQVGYEGRIRKDVLNKREIQAAVILDDNIAQGNSATNATTNAEILSWSATSKGREGWYKRLESGRSAALLSARNLILEQAGIARHDRVLVAAANDGLLLWESLRRCPEGLAAALVDSASAKEALLKFAAILDETDKPLIAFFPEGKIPFPKEAEETFSCSVFDHIVAREPFKRKWEEGIIRAFAAATKHLLSQNGNIVILQSLPKMGERISRIIREECGAASSLADSLAAAEEIFFEKSEESPSNWNIDTSSLENCFKEHGFFTESKTLDCKEDRLLSKSDLDAWFDTERSPWGLSISRSLGEKSFLSIRTFLDERISRGPVCWKWKSVLLKAKNKI